MQHLLIAQLHLLWFFGMEKNFSMDLLTVVFA